MAAYCWLASRQPAAPRLAQCAFRHRRDTPFDQKAVIARGELLHAVAGPVPFICIRQPFLIGWRRKILES
jgi:hypothetical protein